MYEYFRPNSLPSSEDDPISICSVHATSDRESVGVAPDPNSANRKLDLRSPQQGKLPGIC
jgi:hypothetical protein